MKNLLLALSFLLLPASALADDGPTSAPIYAAGFADLDGQAVTLSRLQGKVAVVNFWATWCGPCRQETPELISVHAKYRKDGVEFIGIAVEDNAERIKDFVRAYGIDYPVVMGKDKGIELLQALGNRAAGLPYTLVLDARGRIVAAKRGRMDAERLEKALRAALETADQGKPEQGKPDQGKPD